MYIYIIQYHWVLPFYLLIVSPLVTPKESLKITMSKNGAPRLSDEASFCIHLQEEARVAWRCVHHVPQRSLQKSSWGWATGG